MAGGQGKEGKGGHASLDIICLLLLFLHSMPLASLPDSKDVLLNYGKGCLAWCLH